MKNIRNLSFFTFVLILFVFTSCLKKKKNIPADVDCADAQVCVGNLTHDTIYYEWNSNGLADTLLPGKSTCLNVGPIRCIYNRKTGDIKDKLYSTVTINSTWGTWAINVETCLKKSNFEYNNSNPSSGVIYLYAE